MLDNHHRWLRGELESWLAEGLIEPRQADALRQRYPRTGNDLGLGRLLLTALGSIIFGLGIILFFAYNWEDMPKAAKLAVVFGGLVASHGTGYWLMLRRSSDPGASRVGIEALHLLGTMLFGAGIWLVSQIYHFDNPYPGALLTWGLGALALAWALPSLPQAFVSLALIGGWSWDQVRHFDHQADYLTPALVAFAILPLAYWQRSKALLFFAGGGLLLLLPLGTAPVLDEMVLHPLLCLAASYLGAALLARERGRTELDPMAVLGQLVYFGLLFVLTFEDAIPDFRRTEPETALHWVFFLGFLALALGLLTRPFWPSSWPGSRRAPLDGNHLGARTALLTTLGVLAFAILPFTDSDLPAVLVALGFNLLLLAHGALLIIEGSHRQAWKRATAGSLLISIVVLARFADLFESLLARSGAFLLLGLGLVAVGHYYRRHERTTPPEAIEAGSTENKETDHA